MASFDKSLDKEVFGEYANFDNTKVKVSVMSYNEGAPKLQLSRENFDANSDEFRWSKLGRLTKVEVEGVLPLIEKALKSME